MTFPVVLVQVLQPGASPQEVETQIMQKVEAAVASIGNIDNITSLAIEGQSRVFVQFNIGTPIDRAVADVRDAVAKVRVDLPQGIQEPTVTRIDIDGNEIVAYAVSTSALSAEELSWFVDNTVSKNLLAVEGVSQVTRSGGVSREIRVELDPARMQALGITAAQVNQQLRSLNLDSPGGRAEIGGGEQAIRVLGEARTAHALGDTQIMLPGGRFARLSDLADVKDSVGEIRALARLNGRPATIFKVFKAKGTSDVTVLDGVEAELAKIKQQNPQVTISQVFTTVDYTKATYHSAMSALIEGSILAVLVVFLFLRDMRATLISALAIPLSAIPTFALHAVDGLLAQPDQPAGAVAGGRRAGRRCHRRDREHRAPHAHGQERLPGRARCRRRDRPGGGGDLRHHHRGVPAGELHGRHHRTVLQAVRADGRGARCSSRCWWHA